MKRLIIDLDDTLTVADTGTNYHDVSPRLDVIERLREYHEQGFTIVVQTARNMRTYAGDVGKINVHTLPVVLAWLTEHDVPHDEVVVGKPWCGFQGFYVDDRAVRPDEFVRLSYAEICAMLGLALETAT